MSRFPSLIFEYSFWFIPLCLIVGMGYALLLYRHKTSWSPRVNRFLFGLRALLVTFLALLIIAPMAKMSTTQREKAVLAFLMDNSLSVAEVLDTTQRKNLYDEITTARKSLHSQGFETSFQTLDGFSQEKFHFNHKSSDLNGAVQHIIEKYERKKLAGIVVISDGIYNAGVSPLYVPSASPVYTIGIGDSTQQIDVKIKNLFYNKIVYSGSRYVFRVEVLLDKIVRETIGVSLYSKGKKIARKDKKIEEETTYMTFDFNLEATAKGLQQIDVVVDTLPSERNTKNNHARAYLEVVEGRKKILLLAAASHPDNKALRTVITKNKNYTFSLHIPSEQGEGEYSTSLDTIDLVIVNRILNKKNKEGFAFFQKIRKAAIPLFLILGEDTDWNTPFFKDFATASSNQTTAVTPLVNRDYVGFSLTENAITRFANYPPIQVPWVQVPFFSDTNVLLYQHNSNTKNRPLLGTIVSDNNKIAILLGGGFWRWRMSEVRETGEAKGFDELFSNLIQYLCADKSNKQKFQVFPVQNKFTSYESVTFETQAYNDLLSPLYGYPVTLKVVDESGGEQVYRYVVQAGASRHKIGELSTGIYRYQASTKINGEQKSVEGIFAVTLHDIELQHTTAQFNLLKEWAEKTGGKFLAHDNIHLLHSLFDHLLAEETVSKTVEIKPLINFGIIFFLLLFLASTEWVIRKFSGGY